MTRRAHGYLSGGRLLAPSGDWDSGNFAVSRGSPGARPLAADSSPAVPSAALAASGGDSGRTSTTFSELPSAASTRSFDWPARTTTVDGLRRAPDQYALGGSRSLRRQPSTACACHIGSHEIPASTGLSCPHDNGAAAAAQVQENLEFVAPHSFRADTAGSCGRILGHRDPGWHEVQRLHDRGAGSCGARHPVPHAWLQEEVSRGSRPVSRRNRAPPTATFRLRRGNILGRRAMLDRGLGDHRGLGIVIAAYEGLESGPGGSAPCRRWPVCARGRRRSLPRLTPRLRGTRFRAPSGLRFRSGPRQWGGLGGAWRAGGAIR